MTQKEIDVLTFHEKAALQDLISKKTVLEEWEAAQYLGMCIRSLQELRKNRLIAWVPKGSRGITYRRKDLDKYLTDNLVRAV